MESKLLFFIPHYLPGYKAGGPITSVSNLAIFLGKKADIYIITQDRDLNDDEPYANIQLNRYIQCNTAKVKYLSPPTFSFYKILKEILNCQPKLIYLNSLFSWKFSIQIILMKWLKLFSCKRLILAPRGELSAGALGIKKVKKKFFLYAANFFQLYKNVSWQATSLIEFEDIQNTFNKKTDIVFAPNLPRVFVQTKARVKKKKTNELQIVFLSRISPKKNLLYALDCLSVVNTENKRIVFDIYGPREDSSYWDRCKIISKGLSACIQVNYKGMLAPNAINQHLQQYDLFFLPTLGENYGHVIYESMASGCPVLISNKTPWRNLTKLNVGWDINLAHKKYFIEVINKLIPMTEKDFSKYRQSCLTYAKKIASDTKKFEASKRLFLQE